MYELDRLPLVRVAEVAFPTPKLAECAQFYRQIGLEFRKDPDITEIHFTDVGEQYFGFAHEDRGFMTGYGEEMAKAPLHVAFEIPADKIDECISFLKSKGIKCSPKVEISERWHGAKKATSIYFKDPAGNIMELWAPVR